MLLPRDGACIWGILRFREPCPKQTTSFTSTVWNSRGVSGSALGPSDGRLSIQTLPTDQHRMESPFRDSGSGLGIVESPHSGHVRNSPQFSAPLVHVSNLGVQSTGSGYSITTLAGAVDVHASTISLAEQALPETLSHSERRGDPNTTWWPTQPWLLPLSDPSFRTVETCCLNQVTSQTVSRTICTQRLSCSISKQQGFLEEVSRLAAGFGYPRQTV